MAIRLNEILTDINTATRSVRIATIGTAEIRFHGITMEQRHQTHVQAAPRATKLAVPTSGLLWRKAFDFIPGLVVVGSDTNPNGHYGVFPQGAPYSYVTGRSSSGLAELTWDGNSMNIMVIQAQHTYRFCLRYLDCPTSCNRLRRNMYNTISQSFQTK